MKQSKSYRNPLPGRLSRLAIGLLSFICLHQAYALGLGKLAVQSALDEPLKAEITLIAAQPDELETLKIDLGTVEDFARAGVDRYEHLQELNFTVEGSKIKITTEQPAQEPFLHFLVSVQWQGGKLVREYTALLDPPLYATEQPPAISSPKVVAVEEAPPVPSETSTQVTEATAPVTEPVAEPVSRARSRARGPRRRPAAMSVDAPRSAEYGPTERGDTLWNIASRLDAGQTDANIFQIMIALLRDNPDAFVDNNVNRLKVGHILRLNDLQDISKVSKTEAAVAYQDQYEAWQAYKIEIAQSSEVIKVAASEPGAEAAASGVASAADAAGAAAAGEAAQTAESQQTPAQQPEGAAAGNSEDLLRIVRATIDGESDAANDGADDQGALTSAQREITALRDQITTLEESLVSRELANRELQERVALLESQVQNARRLVELESEGLALAQKQAEERAAAAATQPADPEPAAVETAKTGAADVAGKPQAAEAAGEPQAADANLTAAAKPPAQDAQTQPAQPPAVAEKPKAKRATGVKTADKSPDIVPVSGFLGEQPWWKAILGMVTGSSNWLVSALVGLLVVLSGLLLFIRRRRSIAEFEESILSGSALDGHTETTETAATSGGTDTSFLSDFGMGGMGSMQADEVDPLAEAEVYLAYGRDEQAEEVLKEAINRNTERHELKLKLLEIYQQRNDLKSFETIAEELYPAGEQGDPGVWGKVVEMGRKMNPNNPLFTQQLPVAVTAAAADAMPVADGDEDTLDAAIVNTTGPVDPALKPFPPPDENPVLEQDFGQFTSDMDEGALDDETAADQDRSMLNFSSDDVSEIDFDLELDDLDEEMAAVSPSQTADDSPVDSDFDLDLDSPPSASVEEELGELSLDEKAPDKAPEPTDADDDIDRDPQVTRLKPGRDARPAAQADDEVVMTPIERDDRRKPAPLRAADDEQPVEMPSPSLDMDVPSISGGNGGNGGDADADDQWDEAATKLDLARAYINMGDRAGARSIIDEVMKEGNSSQRGEAAELAAQLG